MCYVRVCLECGVVVVGLGGLPASHPRRLPPQSFQHRWHPQPMRHRRTAAVAGSKAGRACTCACDGAGAAAGRQRPDRRGGLLRGRRGGLDRWSRGRRSSLPHSAVGCKLCVRAVRIGAHIGRERAAARARGFPAGGAGRRTVAWLPPVSVAPSGAAGAAAVAVPTAPVRSGCDNCGGNGPLAAGRYQSRLELQPTMPPHLVLHAWPPFPRQCVPVPVHEPPLRRDWAVSFCASAEHKGRERTNSVSAERWPINI